MSTWQDYFYQNEEQDGVKMSWNLLPCNKAEAAKLHVPVGIFYTPLKEKPNFQNFNHPPIICCKATCAAILNQYCLVDFHSKSWKCIFCGSHNKFPREYSGMTEQQKPPELLPMFSTMSFTIPKPIPLPLAVVFLVDISICTINMSELKKLLVSSLSWLPEETLVSLITFGKHLQLYDLNPGMIVTTYAFNGEKECNVPLLKKILFGSGNTQRYPSANPSNFDPIHQAGHQQPYNNYPAGNQFPNPVSPSAVGGVQSTSKVVNRFMQPLGNCRSKLIEIFNDLKIDSHPVNTSQRSARCIGAAVSFVVNMLEQTIPKSAARVLLFAGGPCTSGPGKIIDMEKKNLPRSHHDIYTDNVPHLKKASDFYENVAKKAAENGHIIDILAGHLDQVGLYEMRYLCNFTGGYMVMSDDFTTSIFKQSFAKIFERNPQTGNFRFFVNGILSIKTTSDFEVRGCIGHCVGLKVANDRKSFTHPPLGIGETTHWKVCSLDAQSTFSFVLEQLSNTPVGNKTFIQFKLCYENPATGTSHMRVSTISREYFNPPTKDSNGISCGFDQDAAAVLLARLVSYSVDNFENPKDVLKRLDRILIRLMQYVANYGPNDPSSFSLPENFLLFPQHLFHLRRSTFLQFFNTSPDEATYHRHYLNHEDVMNASLMFQPVLYSYACNKRPEPSLLDSSSIKKDVILFMDSFYYVCIYHGDAIVSWRNQGYHKNPSYASFAALLEAPKRDAEEVLRERFPVPRYVVADAGQGEARFILCKVNPSKTHVDNSHNFGYSGGYSDTSEPGIAILTDDISLESFIDILKKITVTPS